MLKRAIAISLIHLAPWGVFASRALGGEAHHASSVIWEGSYAGAFAGHSWGDWDSDSAALLFNGSTQASADVDGWLGGAWAGHLWQQGRWVFGIEADVGKTGEDDSVSGTVVDIVVPGGGGSITTTTAATVSWNLPWFATLRGRLGATTNDGWLFFGTAGLAVAEAKFSANQVQTIEIVTPVTGPLPTATATNAGAESSTEWGFTLGAGAERALGHGWSLRAEYLYLDFGKETFLAGTPLETDVDLSDHILRLGVSYRFHNEPAAAPLK